MKRKYDLRNKRNFVIILGIAILVIIVFSLFIYKYKHTSKVEYNVAVGSVLQDVNKNFIDIDKECLLKVRWNDNYYLTYGDNRINLGKDVIVYNTVTNGLKLYGKIYEIETDGKVIEHTGETVLDNTSDAKFYKLADREYLLVDKQIVSTDRSINASNYLLVELDKMGNAKLTNNKLNLKTISPTTLVTSKYTFDIANEVLKYKNLDIDLKKIIGTTNQYKEETSTSSDSNNGGSVEVVNQNTFINNVVNNTPVQGTATEVVTEKEKSNLDGVTLEELKDKLKMSSVMMLNEGLTTIDVDYVIYDPYNEYKTVFVEVERAGSVSIIHLSKTDTHLVIDNLAADTEYKLNFVYTTIDADSGLVKQNTFEEINARTKKPVYSGRITKVSTYTNKLSYAIDLQAGYSINNVNATIIYYYQELNDEGNFVKKINQEVIDVPVVNNQKTATGSISINGYDIVSIKDAKVIINSVSGPNGTVTFN